MLTVTMKQLPISVQGLCGNLLAQGNFFFDSYTSIITKAFLSIALGAIFLVLGFAYLGKVTGFPEVSC